MSFSNDFSQQLNLLMARPGFTKSNAAPVFAEKARKLLDRGVSEQETLAIMQDIYVAGTEYHGSYEAGIEVSHRVMKAGFEKDEAFDLTFEASVLLDWVETVSTSKTPSPLSKILSITISPVGSHA